MNIIEFKEKVYQRIITKYMKDVKKEKIVWSDYSFFLKQSISGSLVLILSLCFFKDDRSFLSLFISLCAAVSCFMIVSAIITSLMEIKHFINFKKQSDIFWGTSLLSIPVLDDSEMKQFFLRDDAWHCKSKYTTKELESLVAFTPKEIEEMKFISFNKEQKDFILNSVEGGIKIDFYSLSELLEISNENIAQQKLLVQQGKQKNIDENKTILQAIGYNLVQEQIMPVNQKVKYLL